MGTSEETERRNNLLLIAIAIVFYVGWTGLEFYRVEMWSKHEALMRKMDQEFKAAGRAKDLEHESNEREKNLELQREIMKKKEESNPN
jgi:predicted Holliday junction resolvase-like endonuclease